MAMGSERVMNHESCGGAGAASVGGGGGAPYGAAITGWL
jgi:hypothetical protein